MKNAGQPVVCDGRVLSRPARLCTLYAYGAHCVIATCCFFCAGRLIGRWLQTQKKLKSRAYRWQKKGNSRFEIRRCCASKEKAMACLRLLLPLLHWSILRFFSCTRCFTEARIRKDARTGLNFNKMMKDKRYHIISTCACMFRLLVEG